MPYLFETLNLLIPENKDRRVKLLMCQKLAIIKMYQSGIYSITGLSKMWKVNKRLIQFIIFPERKEKNIKDREKRGGSKQYYDKDYNTKTTRIHRNYKRKLYLNKELIEKN